LKSHVVFERKKKEEKSNHQENGKKQKAIQVLLSSVYSHGVIEFGHFSFSLIAVFLHFAFCHLPFHSKDLK
jgi:hypothetical protein